ncbi:hypothetical protein [Sphaerothrix gracilis]
MATILTAINLETGPSGIIFLMSLQYLPVIEMGLTVIDSRF